MNNTKFKLLVIASVVIVLLAFIVMGFTDYAHISLFLLLVAFIAMGIAASIHEERIMKYRGYKHLS